MFGSIESTAAASRSRPLDPGRRSRRSRVLIDWFVAQEERIGLDTPGPFRRFEERVFRHRADLSELVTALRSDGASVMGYGASTKGNVLLQFCGFGPDDIEAIAEVNEDKFGRVTPGTGIPIVLGGGDAATRSRLSPRLPVALPRRSRRAGGEYLRSGGRLIFPLPEIEIVGA